MTYAVELERAATAGLAKLPRVDQKRVWTKLTELKTNPRPVGARKLENSPGYRIRSGNFRIVYLVDDAAQIVTVTRIADRKNAYRRF